MYNANRFSVADRSASVTSTLIRWKQQLRRAEADRRAEYDRRVEIARVDYDKRFEMARRDEYDRRMEYDLSVLCQIRKVSTAEDFELQVRRLDEMGKIIDTPTTIIAH